MTKELKIDYSTEDNTSLCKVTPSASSGLPSLQSNNDNDGSDVNFNFMNLPEEYSGESSKFIIINIPWEKDVTSGKGASKGPEEILKASYQLEYFDIDYEKEIFEKGIKTITLKPKVFEDIAKQIPALSKKFPVFIGGDHSVTIPVVRSIKEDFDLVVFDAHADFFYSWNGSENNHRCVNRKLIDKHNILVVGLRSCDVEEFKEINKNQKIDYIKSSELNIDLLKEKLSKLKKKVYASIDIDVFDPSFIRNTGTPEPGGLTWDQVIAALEETFAEKEVIAADIVEFAPNNNYEAEAYSLAKLIHKIFILKTFKNK